MQGTEAALDWVFEPSVVIGLAALAGGYLAAVGPARRLIAGSAPVSAGRQATYLAGVAALAIALCSPLDSLSDDHLFSIHMIQHLILTMMGPPLMLLGLPDWLVRFAVRGRAPRVALRLLTRPLVALVLYNAVFDIWHVPDLYDLALETNAIHIFEHLTFIGAAFLLWWPICGPDLADLPKPSYPLRMLYLFANSLLGFALGAYITLQNDIIYPFYGEAVRLWGLSALDDQRLGGLIMWVGMSTFYLVVIAVLFIAWASAEGHEAYGDSAQDRARQ